MATGSKLTGGAFLFEETNTTDLFIPEEFTEEQLMISNSVKEFMLKEVHGLGIERVASLDAEKDKALVMDNTEAWALISIPHSYSRRISH
jgi:hypothetical protein